MIEAYESGRAPAFELYGLALEHKHVPEIQTYSGLAARPLFVPSVGNFPAGDAGQRSAASRRAAGQAERRRSARRVRGALSRLDAMSRSPSESDAAAQARLEPESLNGSNDMEIYVYANEARRQAVLVAKFDNLGKGASGAAVQNLELMLGRSARLTSAESRGARRISTSAPAT